MTEKKSKIILLLCSLAFFFDLSAQEVPVITMDSCLGYAIENNSEIRVLSFERTGALSSHKIVRAALYPSVGISANVSPKASDTVVDGKTKLGYVYDLSSGIGVSYTIISPGRSESVAISAINLDSTKLAHLKRYNNLLVSVKSQYLFCLKSEQNVELSSAILARYQRVYDKLAIEYRSGRIRPVELSSWEVKLGEAKISKDKASFELNRLRRDLFLTIGVQDIGQVLSKADLNELAILKYSVEDLMRIAEGSSPDLLLVQQKLEMSKLALSRSKASREPSVSVSSSAGYANSIAEAERSEDGIINCLEPNKENWAFGVTVSLSASMPLYTGGRISADIDRSSSDLSIASSNLKSTQDRIRSVVTDKYQSLQFLADQIKVSEKNVKNAEINLKIMERSYESGLESLSDLAEASESLKQSQLSLINNKIDYIITLSELANVVGVSEEMICLAE